MALPTADENKRKLDEIMRRMGKDPNASNIDLLRQANQSRQDILNKPISNLTNNIPDVTQKAIKPYQEEINNYNKYNNNYNKPTTNYNANSTISNNIKPTPTRTMRSVGYDKNYDNRYKEINNMIEYGNRTGQQDLVRYYQNALSDLEKDKVKRETFFDWDMNDFQDYVKNKFTATQLYNKYNDWNHPELRALAQKNQALRDKYGLKEDIYTYNDLGQLASDAMYADFLGYGLTKGGNAREQAEMMSRRDYLYGYEPLGQVKEINGVEFKPNYGYDAKVFRDGLNRSQGIPIQPRPIQGVTANNTAIQTPVNQTQAIPQQTNYNLLIDIIQNDPEIQSIFQSRDPQVIANVEQELLKRFNDYVISNGTYSTVDTTKFMENLRTLIASLQAQLQ